MGELDIAAKVLLRTEPGALIALAMPGAHVRSVRAEETELPAQTLAMDKLFRVQLAGHASPRWQHLEVVANWASHVPETTFTYWSRARVHYPRLRSLVLVLKPGDRQGTPLGEYVVHDDDDEQEEVLRFKFRHLCAWTLDADKLLRLGPPGLLPLLPFAGGASPDRVDQALRALDKVRPRPRRAELLAALAAFAGNVYPEVLWRAKIPMEILMESTFYNEVLAEGRARGETEGARSILMLQLRLFLGDLAEVLIGRVEAASGAQVAEAARAFAQVREPEALVAALDALLPPAPTAGE